MSRILKFNLTVFSYVYEQCVQEEFHPSYSDLNLQTILLGDVYMSSSIYYNRFTVTEVSNKSFLILK
jgi:hypothetical protein